MRDRIGGQQRIESVDTVQPVHQKVSAKHGEPVATDQLGGRLGEQRQRP